MTSKLTHDFGTELVYDREASNPNIIELYKAIQDELFNKYNTPVIFTSIVPASVIKYRDFNFNKFDNFKNKYRLTQSLFSDSDLVEQQKNMEEDVML